MQPIREPTANEVLELEPSSTGLDARLAGLLTYLLGAVTGLIFLIVERRSPFVRFHAIQSTLTFGSIFVLEAVSSLIPVVGPLLLFVLGPLSFVLWVLLMVKAYQGEPWELPIVGEIAREHREPRRA